MTYYNDLQRFNNHVETVMKLIIGGTEMPVDRLLYDSTLRFPVSKKSARERIDEAVIFHDLEINVDGVIINPHKIKKNG